MSLTVLAITMAGAMRVTCAVSESVTVPPVISRPDAVAVFNNEPLMARAALTVTAWPTARLPTLLENAGEMTVSRTNTLVNATSPVLRTTKKYVTGVLFVPVTDSPLEANDELVDTVFWMSMAGAIGNTMASSTLV